MVHYLNRLFVIVFFNGNETMLIDDCVYSTKREALGAMEKVIAAQFTHPEHMNREDFSVRSLDDYLNHIFNDE